MIINENRLRADDSHEVSCLICYVRKSGNFFNCRLLHIIDGALRVRDRISPDNHPKFSILENQHLKSLTSDKTLAKTAIATSADFLVFFDPN